MTEDEYDEYEYGEEPNWRDEIYQAAQKHNLKKNPADSEHDFAKTCIDLIKKSSVLCTRYQLLVPFAHDSSKQYVGGVIYLDSSRYWRVEGDPEKFKSSEDAIMHLAIKIELNRHIMVNEAFRNSGI